MADLPFLLVTFIPLTVMTRWMYGQMWNVASAVTLGSKRGTSCLYNLLFLPGAVLHEFSHWLAAMVLGVKVTGCNPISHVTTENTDPIRGSLIGVAPLLAGSLATFGVGYLAFQSVGAEADLVSANWRVMFGVVWTMVGNVRYWHWLYLIFAFANSMLPSKSDQWAWPPVVIFLAFVAGLVYLAGGQEILGALAFLLNAYVRWLAIASLLALLVNIPVAVMVVLTRGFAGPFTR